MLLTDITFTIISLIVAIISLMIALVFNLLNTRRNINKDNFNRMEELGSMKTDIKYIRNNIDNIKADVKEIFSNNQDFNQRLSKVEIHMETIRPSKK